MAAHASATFWHVILLLQTFLRIPVLRKRGADCRLALMPGLVLTIIRFDIMAQVGQRFGLRRNSKM